MTTASFLTSAPAGAADDPLEDCSKAGSMMSDASKMGSSETITGDQDKDFSAIMMDREKGSMMLLRVEVKCGTNVTEKALAQKLLAQEQQRIELFRNVATSQ